MIANFSEMGLQFLKSEKHFMQSEAGRSKEGKNMKNLFSLIVRYEFLEDARPKSGWTIYKQTPKGLKPLTTKRGKLRRFSTLDKVFPWAAKNYAGYGLQIEGPYEGLLLGEK